MKESAENKGLVLCPKCGAKTRLKLLPEKENFRRVYTKCGKDMRRGYLFSSKDGAFSFADKVPGVLENAKNTEGFVKLTVSKLGSRTSVEACLCGACRMLIVPYGEEKRKYEAHVR